MKKRFQLSPLLSVNPSQMYTFLTCHQSLLKSQGDVCEGTQPLDSTAIPVTRRAIPQRDQ